MNRPLLSNLVRTIAVGLVAATVLAGCSTGDGNTNDPTSTTSPPATGPTFTDVPVEGTNP
jgi:hypothetical protein